MFETAFSLVVILLSVVIHEVSHGYAAYISGDPTAHHEGRLTLNPIPHIDFIGTIVIPFFLLVSGSGVLFGWAKPVPYNPYNLRGRFSEAFVAAAGSLSNILLAAIFALVGNAIFLFAPEFSGMLRICELIIFVNLFLAILNLLPIPPLDGAKVITGLLPVRHRLALLERFSRFLRFDNIFVLIGVLLVLVFFVAQHLASFTSFLLGALLVYM